MTSSTRARGRARRPCSFIRPPEAVISSMVGMDRLAEADLLQHIERGAVDPAQFAAGQGGSGLEPRGGTACSASGCGAARSAPRATRPPRRRVSKPRHRCSMRLFPWGRLRGASAGRSAARSSHCDIGPSTSNSTDTNRLAMTTEALNVRRNRIAALAGKPGDAAARVHGRAAPLGVSTASPPTSLAGRAFADMPNKGGDLKLGIDSAGATDSLDPRPTPPTTCRPSATSGATPWSSSTSTTSRSPSSPRAGRRTRMSRSGCSAAQGRPVHQRQGDDGQGRHLLDRSPSGRGFKLGAQGYPQVIKDLEASAPTSSPWCSTPATPLCPTSLPTTTS